MRVAVIGAGASGLVAAKYLADEGHHVVMFEQSSGIGGTFVNKVYDDTRLVSSKFLTAFSDLRMGPEVPEHPSVQDYVSYLEAYKAKFLDERATIELRFETRVDEVLRRTTTKDCTAKYTVTSSSQGASKKEETFEAIAVCSGLHNVPKIPTEAELPGLQEFMADKATICIHSSEYKHKSIFKDRNVLILGCGETAMDITTRAVRGDASTVGIVVREGFLSIPHLMAEQKPLDVFITNLFEHCYEHPWVHFLQLRWKLSTFVIRLGLLVMGGSSWGFGQWACRVQEVKRGFHIINKAHGALPNINKGYRLKLKQQGQPKTLLARVWERAWGAVERAGVMTLGLADDAEAATQAAAPARFVKPVTPFNAHVSRITKTAPGADGSVRYAVEFANGERAEPVDTLVMATGYRQEFPFLQGYRAQLSALDPAEEARLAEERAAAAAGGCFRHSQGDDYLPAEHLVTDPRDPHLAFVGFARPNVGAIPPQSELQVQWWLQRAGLARGAGAAGEGAGALAEGAGGKAEARVSWTPQFKFPDDDQYVRGWVTAPNGRTSEVHFWWEVLAGAWHGVGNLLRLPRRLQQQAAGALPLRPGAPPSSSPNALLGSGSLSGASSSAGSSPALSASAPALAPSSLYRPAAEDPAASAREKSYLLLGRKYRYGVDYGNYMHRLAEDFGAAPVLSEMCWDALTGRRGAAQTYKVLFAYCLGQAYPPFFRLRGPYASEAQWDIAATELYQVNVDRGFLENVGLVAMSVFFAALNFSFWGLEAAAWTLGLVAKRRGFGRYC